MFREFVALPLAVLGVISASCAPSLVASPRLVAVWPTAEASLSVARHTLDLTFNRPLNPDATAASVWRDLDGVPMASRAETDAANPRHLKVHLLEPAVGEYQLHWHAVAAQSGLAADGDHAFVLRNESPMPPRVDVSPASVDVGDRLELVGKGFGSDMVVQFTMGDDAQQLADVRTDRGGNFDLEARVPDSVPFGVQPVVAVDGQGREASGAVMVRWGGWPPVGVSNVAQPGPSAGDVSFTLNVRNRSDYVVEHLRLVMQDPDGGVLVGAFPGPQRQGSTLVWEIPVMDRGVLGPFRATYRTPSAAVGHAWLEFRHRHASGCTRDECLPAFISESTADSALVAPAD
jgi:methionine-rich copper-binding protein CopC